MRALLMLVDLCLALPWWGVALVAAGVVGSIAAIGLWLSWKLQSLTQEALTLAGSPLADAHVTVHSIRPAERPTSNSLFDVDDDDDADDEDAEGEAAAAFDGLEGWQTEGDFYWLDVTIDPREPTAEWDASVLTLVPAAWKSAHGEISEHIGPLHSVELAAQGGFQPLSDGEDHLTGRQRVRLLMAAPPGHAHVKLANFGATLGDLRLPAPLLAGAC